MAYVVPLDAIPRKWDIRTDRIAAWTNQVDVLLDGKRVERCYAFDLDAGTASRLLVNESGRPYLDASRCDAARETLRGAVELRYKGATTVGFGPTAPGVVVHPDTLAARLD